MGVCAHLPSAIGWRALPRSRGLAADRRRRELSGRVLPPSAIPQPSKRHQRQSPRMRRVAVVRRPVGVRASRQHVALLARQRVPHAQHSPRARCRMGGWRAGAALLVHETRLAPVGRATESRQRAPSCARAPHARMLHVHVHVLYPAVHLRLALHPASFGRAPVTSISWVCVRMRGRCSRGVVQAASLSCSTT